MIFIINIIKPIQKENFMHVQSTLHWETLGSGPSHYHQGYDLIGKKVENLTEAERTEVEFRCRPDHCSESGFLGTDEVLKTCYENDQKVLISAGVTHEQIAERLNKIFAIYGEQIQNQTKDKGSVKSDFGDYEVSHSYFMGSQYCPFSTFADDIYCSHGRVDFSLKKKGDDTTSTQ